MITFTEFFLFFALILAILYGLYWRNEAKKAHWIFNLMVSNEEAREDIIKGYHEFKRTQ